MTKFSSCKLHSSTFTKLGLACCISLATLAPVNQAHAVEKGYTNYITDSLEVPLRRGAGYKFKITRMLQAGEPVKILEVNKDGWANVQYKSGGSSYIGWLPSVVLQNQPVAKTRLAEQIKKTTELEEKYTALQQELKTLKTRFEKTDSELTSTKQDKFELSKQLERITSISSNAVELDQQNQQMKVRLTQLETDNAIMKEQIDQSDDSLKRQWFLTGGGVLLLGMLIGRLMRAPGKRKKWGEL